MKNDKYNLGNTNLSYSDMEAILCALPLMDQVSADSPEQDMRNAAAVDSASKKLFSMINSAVVSGKKSLNRVRFTAEDIRVVDCAIGFALDILSGRDPGYTFQINDEWKAELSRYYFTLNRLCSIYGRLVDEIESKL